MLRVAPENSSRALLDRVVMLFRMQDSFIPGLLGRGGPASRNQRGDSVVTGRAVTTLIGRAAASS